MNTEIERKMLSIQDNPDMGLNNEICKNKKFFCALHQVYLSEDDVKEKKCLCKPTYDLMGVQICTSLRDLEHNIVKNIN